MKSNFSIHVGLLLLAGGAVGTQATERFVALDGGHVAPFTSWADAATNIQVAIDVASDGDTVWVADGIYATGGKVMAGDLTNRIAVDKPILVRSLNGPHATTIQGAWHASSTNGFGAVRCAWLTNGATLSGFTLRGGATRSGVDSTGVATNSGGGVWSTSTSCLVTNCVIAENTAAYSGGGVYLGTVVSSVIRNNRVFNTNTGGNSYGGGAYSCILRNCALLGNELANTSNGSGGGAYGGAMTNCTVVGNIARSGGGLYLVGTPAAPAVNCIVWGNILNTYSGATNSSGVTFRYSCSSPLPSGTGNISVDPQFIGDGFHLLSDSPCRGTGTNLTSGLDIDGQWWSNPPSMGCDEWNAAAVISSAPRLMPGPNGQLQIVLSAAVGREPIAYSWLKDGASVAGENYGDLETVRLLVSKLGPADVGSYQVIASNAFGMATSAVVRVVVHCVDAAGASPLAPYADWASAATNIQTAIDAAAIGDIVLVTNGMYDTGGKVMAGDLTNRIALDKALIVMSVNGATTATIEGTPGLGGVNATLAPNGPQAVRCAWLGKDTILSGFTLRGGGTRISNGTFDVAIDCGGGIWCASQYGLVSYCVIQENSANFQGGGSYGATLNNCQIVLNGAGVRFPNRTYSGYGGGVYNAYLNNCLAKGNQAGQGGGTHTSVLSNCTVTGNSIATGSGRGTQDCTIRNSIVWNNFGSLSGDISGGSAEYSCAGNAVSGTSNITSNPLFLADGFHLSSASPCRGAASAAYTSGTDIDGQTWTNPPSMGCDQWLPEPLLLDFKMQTRQWNQFNFKTWVAGIESSPGYWFKDGAVLSESAHYTGAETTGLTVQGLSASDSGNYQLIVSNVFGMATSRVAQITVHFVSAGNPGAVPPYTNWQTAADTIQDAIDAATADDLILVTNGIYDRGGKPLYGEDTTNRIGIDRPLLVVSVNGPFQTVVEGRWDPVSTNGINAVRCALLSSNAGLAGFTLRNGATGTNGAGGGVSVYFDELVASCVISNNRASRAGGGYSGSYLNCWFINNSASGNGGGAYSVRGLNNCTIVGNTAGSLGGGTIFGLPMTNCIVWFNSAPSLPNTSSSMYNSCSPAPSGSGNITSDPQLVDGLHLAATSPCLGAGGAGLLSATDLDGDPWFTPPSMGCDEFNAATLVGSLLVTIESSTNVLVSHSLALTGRLVGRASSVVWDYGDGVVLTNGSYVTSHVWTNPGDYLVTFTAFNTDNPVGVSGTSVIHVDPIFAPTLSAASLASGTNFQFQFGGQPGANYWVEYATNLSPPITWLTLKSLTSTGGVEQIVDAKATNTARFYRVRAQ